ncbi:MAG: ATP-dependent DNA helicase, partial [Pseudoxanthomonas sp.]
PLSGIQDAGRWVPVRAQPEAERTPEAARRRAEAVEHVARVLLRRYGVVCWRLVEREAAWLPPWRELVRVLQRLEARGEVRGGRFIAGPTGEQFALPEAVGLLRQTRHRAADGQPLWLSAGDSANLLGGLLAGERIARVPGNRVAYLDGLPVAVRVQERVSELIELTPAQRAALQLAAGAIASA